MIFPGKMVNTRRKNLLVLLFLLLFCDSGTANHLSLATKGGTAYSVLLDPQATADERCAASELTHFLKRITGATFPVRESARAPGIDTIFVGPGTAVRLAFPEVDHDKLGPEEVVICTQESQLLLTGGRPRGTLYAVYRFLQESCGCRWWAPWAESIPFQSTLTIPSCNRRERPCFRWRDPCWFPAFDTKWAARNQVNGSRIEASSLTGGNLHYAGFVHTFATLVPPEQHFPKHPEWFSLVDGQRTSRGQLCLTNPDLRRFVVHRVKQRIREHPEAQIVSVSQNDTDGNCQCVQCRAQDEEEGSPAGSLLNFVNHVAREVAEEHPHVLVDTLAYTYSRKPPRTLRAEPNVAVRICSTECDFGVPLDHPRNVCYFYDLVEWRSHCSNLFAWDYTTNFSNYLLPHPNWFVLGPNLRIFQMHGVVGVFSQGADRPNGGELPELRSWLLARLMWDPQQDDQALIDEFLSGYYGPRAALFIRQYLNLIHRALGNAPLTCFNRAAQSPFLKFAILQQAERLWDNALEAARPDPDRIWRIEQGRLSVRYAFLVRWPALQRECEAQGGVWPFALSRRGVGEDWLRKAAGPGPEGWAPLESLEEYPDWIRPEEFVKRLSKDFCDRPAFDRSAVPGVLALLRACLLGSPRDLFFPGICILVCPLFISGLNAGSRYQKTEWVLSCGGIACLTTGLLLCVWHSSQNPARQAGIVVLTVVLAVFLGTLRLFSQLGRSGRGRVMVLVIGSFSMLFIMVLMDRHYFQLRFWPVPGRDYSGVSFVGASLNQANLDRSNFQEADLAMVNLQKSFLNYANMRNARLCGSDLRGAMLSYTNLQGADLRGDDLRDTRIIDATFTSLIGAIYDVRTRWPDGFDPLDWDMIFVE